MKANFDYRHVWASTLLVATPMVHDPTWNDRYFDDHFESRTRCGMGVLYRGKYDPNDDRPKNRRQVTWFSEYGAHLYADHAAAIGARWCKRCFPSVTS